MLFPTAGLRVVGLRRRAWLTMLTDEIQGIPLPQLFLLHTLPHYDPVALFQKETAAVRLSATAVFFIRLLFVKRVVFLITVSHSITPSYPCHLVVSTLT